jgi:hypothetical protein
MKGFHHPEGGTHPRPPSHLKKVKRYDFGEQLFGHSSKIIKKYLKEVKPKNMNRELSVSRQVRNLVYDRHARKKYVDYSLKYLRNKKISNHKVYDIVLIGAGIHTATYIYTLKKTNSKLKVLVLEKSQTVCSTFYNLGDSLVLNSPTFSKVGLNSNIVPGHFIQLSDFDELYDRPFPTAKHLYELAAMMFLHADADIKFGCNVKSIESSKGRYLVESKGEVFKGKKIILANGMGRAGQFLDNSKSSSKRIISGDDFIKKCYESERFFNTIKDKRVAVIGDGDTANCVMEYLLPLVYPNHYYGFYREVPLLPKSIVWIGQKAKNIQDYFFANKSRYCHSGGVIEFFWDEETPFELSTEIWKQTKELVTCTEDKLVSLKQTSNVKLETNNHHYEVDFVIDCTGRFNSFSKQFLSRELSYINGDITLYGGQWIDEADRFVVSPRCIKNKRIAAKVEGDEIYFIGAAGPLAELICDDEAKDGSLRYQEERLSLTNSKWSLEHTLPRTIALAQMHAELL